MKLEIIRNPKENYTAGQLLVDGKHFAWTLEDKMRPDGQKIYGETAIPLGTYKVIITYSNRFKKQMLQLVNVKGGKLMFGELPIDACGIRIHGGNTTADTLGCPLIGKMGDGESNKISNCAGVVQDLFDRVKKATKTSDVLCEIKLKQQNI